MKLKFGRKTVYLSILHLWEQGTGWPERDTEVATWLCFNDDPEADAFDDFNTYRDWVGERGDPDEILSIVAEYMVDKSGWTIRRTVTKDISEVEVR